MNTKYELARLEGIISDDISAFIKQNCRLDQILYREFKIAIKQETERVKTSLSNAAFDFKKRSGLKRYVRFHQQEIIRLSGDLIKYVPPKRLHAISESLDNALLCQQLYWSLEDLLSFVAKHFTEYFDLDAWVPESYRLIAVHQLQRSLRQLHLGLVHREMDKKLIGLLLCPFKEFVDTSLNEVTYRRVIYLKELERELFRVIEIANNPTSSDMHRQILCSSLIKINYNSPSFFKYYTEHINETVATCETLSDRIDKVAYFYKVVNQINVVQKITFNPSLPGIREQLLEWISCELDYLHQKQQLHLSIGEDDLVSKDFKINFSLSVAHLAFLFKAFVETGVIQNKNTSELIRFLAKFVKTKKSEAVSYESFRIKFYNAEIGTKDAVKKTLQLLLNYMNKN
jgi:hypothetical protein